MDFVFQFLPLGVQHNRLIMGRDLGLDVLLDENRNIQIIHRNDQCFHLFKRHVLAIVKLCKYFEHKYIFKCRKDKAILPIAYLGCVKNEVVDRHIHQQNIMSKKIATKIGCNSFDQHDL